MTAVTLTVSDETRQALDRTAKYLRAQAQWLQQAGSVTTLPQVVAYAAALERLSTYPPVTPMTGDERDAVQQAAFLLEGARNSLRNADFKDRADKVSRDITRLHELVTDYNGAVDKT